VTRPYANAGSSELGRHQRPARGARVAQASGRPRWAHLATTDRTGRAHWPVDAASSVACPPNARARSVAIPPGPTRDLLDRHAADEICIRRISGPPPPDHPAILITQRIGDDQAPAPTRIHEHADRRAGISPARSVSIHRRRRSRPIHGIDVRANDAERTRVVRRGRQRGTPVASNVVQLSLNADSDSHRTDRIEL
jgi:hypothetical protein